MTETAVAHLRPVAAYSCGDITPEAVRHACEADPRMAAKIEAAMICASCLRDEERKRVPRMQLPIALIVAILQVAAADDPQAAALAFHRRSPPP